MKCLSDFYVKAGAKDHRNDDYNTAYDNGDEHVMMNKRMRLRGILILGHQLHLHNNFLREYTFIARSVPQGASLTEVLKCQQDGSGVENRLAMACRGWASWRPMCKKKCANALSITIPAKDLLLTKRHFLAR